ncbi:MAG: hypothetical protein H0V19_07835 [Euzebyales bacterium]|nr:hypothetical protein [Euzebyales bacterium]
MRRPGRRALLAAVLAGLLLGCGEPPVDVAIPAREPGEHVLDQAGILAGSALPERLEALAADGLDVVALTYETEQAGCGEAFRAGGELTAAWDADVALVAVARPGDFEASGQARQRCLGVRPRDERAVPGALRQRIAEEIVPRFARRNDWRGAFEMAADVLAEEVGR